MISFPFPFSLSAPQGATFGYINTHNENELLINHLFLMYTIQGITEF